MADEKYVHPSLTDAASISVGGNCYGRVGPSEHPPDAVELQGEYQDCDDCHKATDCQPNDCCRILGPSDDLGPIYRCCYSPSSQLEYTLDMTVIWDKNNNDTERVHRSFTLDWVTCISGTMYGVWGWTEPDCEGDSCESVTIAGREVNLPVADFRWSMYVYIYLRDRVWQVWLDPLSDPNASCCGCTYAVLYLKDPIFGGTKEATGTGSVSVVDNDCCIDEGTMECCGHGSGCDGDCAEFGI